MNDVTARRHDYERGALEATDLDPNPIVLLGRWLQAAVEAGVREPNAMTLATADASARPSARVVLLRGIDERGFAWYTNRTSLKGRDLAANPQAALVFHWEPIERQVRASGTVSVIDDEESRAYFAGRPRKSQLAAWASPQGQAVASRAELETAMAAIDARYPEAVPLPPFWGGYRLVPEMVEFWQGRRDRMHDRFMYLREGDRWHIERLAP